MTFRIVRVDSSRLPEFDHIPISFEVRSIYDVIDEHDPITLHEQTLAVPYIKDYDDFRCDPAESWSNMNTATWGVFLALDAMQNDKPIGGAIVTMPECALLDLRVEPAHRGMGVGRTLFEHAVQWAREQGVATQMSIETQNTNVPACRFYAAMGARLGDVDRHAYRDDERVQHEVRLNWYIDLPK